MRNKKRIVVLFGVFVCVYESFHAGFHFAIANSDTFIDCKYQSMKHREGNDKTICFLIAERYSV